MPNSPLAEEGGERRAVELLGDVERLAAVPLQHRLQHLDAGLVGLRQEAGEPPFDLAAHPDRSGGSHFRTPSEVGDVRPFVGRGLRRQDRKREADPLRHLAAELDGLDPKTGGQRHVPVGSV